MKAQSTTQKLKMWLKTSEESFNSNEWRVWTAHFATLPYTELELFFILTCNYVMTHHRPQTKSNVWIFRKRMEWPSNSNQSIGIDNQKFLIISRLKLKVETLRFDWKIWSILMKTPLRGKVMKKWALLQLEPFTENTRLWRGHENTSNWNYTKTW